MIPQGLRSSKPVFKAAESPTTSSTTSAPLPSVSSFIRLSRPSRSVWKFQGSAPKDLASSSRDGIESTARRYFGLYSCAFINAHSPTGPHPMRTTVDVKTCSFVNSLKALYAAKYPEQRLVHGAGMLSYLPVGNILAISTNALSEISAGACTIVPSAKGTLTCATSEDDLDAVGPIIHNRLGLHRDQRYRKERHLCILKNIHSYNRSTRSCHPGHWFEPWLRS